MITEREPIAKALSRCVDTNPTASLEERAAIVADELNLPIATVLDVAHELEDHQ